MDVLYIVIPAYNEAQNLPDVIHQWYPIVSSHNAEGKSKLIVLNDGSRDETRDVLEELKKDRPLLEAVDKENEGHGPTLIRGYKQALAEHADFIFQTDSDGQTNPNEFESFWEKRHDYDAVFEAAGFCRKDSLPHPSPLFPDFCPGCQCPVPPDEC